MLSQSTNSKPQRINSNFRVLCTWFDPDQVPNANTTECSKNKWINETSEKMQFINIFFVCAFHFRVFIVEHFGLGCCNMQCNEMHMINWILRNLVSSMILVHSIFCCCCWESALRILCIFNVLVVSFGLYSSLFYVTVALQYVYVCARVYFLWARFTRIRVPLTV